MGLMRIRVPVRDFRFLRILGEATSSLNLSEAEVPWTRTHRQRRASRAARTAWRRLCRCARAGGRSGRARHPRPPVPDMVSDVFVSNFIVSDILGRPTVARHRNQSAQGKEPVAPRIQRDPFRRHRGGSEAGACSACNPSWPKARAAAHSPLRHEPAPPGQSRHPTPGRVDRARLGLHHRPVRLRRHQQPRGRRAPRSRSH